MPPGVSEGLRVVFFKVFRNVPITMVSIALEDYQEPSILKFLAKELKDLNPHESKNSLLFNTIIFLL